MKAAIKSAFRAIIAHHLTQYPSLGVIDLYKLVFQAAMGSEHAVPDAGKVERRLKAEAESMTPAPDSPPMIDPVSPDHRLVRVNLHPYITRNGDLRHLADAFMETSRTFKPSAASLTVLWGRLVEMAAAKEIPFTADELEDVGAAQQKSHHPAVHHSSIYRQQYHPAYRVVLINRIELPAG